VQRCHVFNDDSDELQDIDGDQLPVVIIGFVKKRPLYNVIWKLNVPPEAMSN
jgi:hypothetical protein